MDIIKDENLKLFKSIKTSHKKQKGKFTQSKSGNRNGKGKTKGNTDRQMYPQDNWKLEAPKYGYVHTQNIDKKIYHWFRHHYIWTVRKPENCEMVKAG